MTIENQYEIISKVGEGGYGIVYKARDFKTNNIVSIKQINSKHKESNEEIPQSILCEIYLLQELKGNSNVINMIDIIINKLRKKIYIIYEYYEYDLYTLIYQTRTISIQQIKSYMKQMLIALQAVHSKGYIHGDIKPGNFLISSENEVKLIDFGASEKIDEKKRNYKIGTFCYNAPELILGSSDYGIEIDIWALGCTFYEMMTKERFIDNCYNNSEIAEKIVNIFGIPSKKDFPQFFSLPNKDLFLNNIRNSGANLENYLEIKLPDHFKPLKNLLINMLQLNPVNRISLFDALNDPAFIDAELPENLPILTTAESNYKSYKKNYANLKKTSELYHLRPIKIVPPNFS